VKRRERKIRGMASKGKGAEEREPQNSEEVVQMYQQARTPLKIRV